MIPTTLVPMSQFQTYPVGASSLWGHVALVRSGVVLMKDMSFTAAFELQGYDIANVTPAYRNHAAQRLSQIYTNGFNGNWMTQNDLFRKPAVEYPALERSSFPDPISRAIEIERRNHFLKAGNHYESTNIMVIRCKPPALQNPKLTRLLYENHGQEKLQSTLESNLEDFERALRNFEDAMSTLFRMRRLGSYTFTDKYGDNYERDELVNYVNFTMTGEHHPVNIPPPPNTISLSELLCGQDLFPGNEPKIGEQYIAAVSITGVPHASYPNILEVLGHLPMSYRWSTRMQYLDEYAALDDIKKKRLAFQQTIYSPLLQFLKIRGGTVNQDAVNLVMDTDAAMADVHSGEMIFGHCTQTVVALDEDREVAMNNARMVVREVKRLGFNARLETVNALEAWLGSLPGHSIENVRCPLTHSRHLTHMIPITTIWTGHECAPNPLYPPGLPSLMHTVTTGSTPFRMNLHVGDVGHTLITGPTGGGKSVFLNTTAVQFLRYPGATITAFDKGRSMWALVEACGGRHYDIGGDGSTLSFAPLSVLDTDQDIAWAEEWIASVYEARTDKTPTPRQAQEIHRAMTILRAKQRHERSLSDFVLTLQQTAPDDDMKDALRLYTQSGQYGNLLDAREDHLQDAHFSVFEIEELMAMKERIAIPVLLYLFRRFERSLQGQPALLLLDEAWTMLGHPVFREKIRQWLKELRKKNCAVVMATQSLSDSIRSGIYDVLLESCPTKILLPNEEADKTGTAEHPGPRDFYAMMGLNDTEIEIIRTATKKREYYYISPEGRRLFDLGLGPVALSFVAVSDKEKLAHLKQLKAQYGSDWPYVWLKERGLRYETLA